MADLKQPYGEGVVTVPDELVDRYKAAGYVEVKATRSTTKRAASKSKSDDDK
jgi:hypothetical protein